MTAVTHAPRLPSWLERAFPYRRRRVSTSHGHIDVVDAGPPSARAVLLMHGNPTWSYLWRKVISLINDPDLRILAPDLLGFGTSTKLRRSRDHRVETHVDAMTQVVDALEVRSFVAVGQDWGGPIVCGVCTARPERVDGLVLGNTAVVKPARPFRATAFHRFARAPIASDLAFRGLLFPIPVMHQVQGDRRTMGWREKAAYAWPLLDPRHRAGAIGLARMVPDREEHPSVPALDRIGGYVEAYRGPAALVWGERDPVLGRGLRRHREALPQASVRATDAGHFSQLEVPELWSDAIREVVRASAG
ncbi:MAG: alpha/beta fold hydrolase [Sandaracinaceae bacterium]